MFGAVVAVVVGVVVGLAGSSFCRRLGAPRWIARLLAIAVAYGACFVFLKLAMPGDTSLLTLLMFSLGLSLVWGWVAISVVDNEYRYAVSSTHQPPSPS